MSLNGTLETFALPDVLALLAATRKTGELQVNGGRGDARVWLDKGQMVAADVPRATTFVDAIFEMLRLTSGKFAFDNDGRASDPSEPVSLEPLLQEAQSRLGEWRSIEAVVPSLACGVSLTSEVSTPHVTVTGEQWRALVAVAASRDVEGVMTRLGLGEFASCRMLKDLVHTGLVSIGEPLAPPAPAPAPKQEAAPAPAPTAAAAAPADAAAAAAGAPAPAAAALDTAAMVAASRAGAKPAAQAVKPAVAGARPTAQPTKPAVAGAGSTAAEPTTPVGPRPRITPMLEGDAGTAPVVAPAPRRAPAPAPAPVPAAAPVKADATPTSKSDATPKPEATAKTPAPEVRHATSGTPARMNAASDEATESETADEPGDEDEPINRGLLLKFLNSVRS